MVEILAYAFGIMYSPGPVNLLGLNAGIHGHGKARLQFCLGVACAMLFLLLLFGYTGAWLVTPRYQLLISSAGCVYIAYLAYKVALSGLESPGIDKKNTAGDTLNFRAGLIMQLLNPKAFVAILPIVTVQFPAAEISGSMIFVWSLVLAGMAFGAPGSYILMGARLGKLISKPLYFRVLNISMALLLFYVAGEIAYSHVYLKWV